MRELAYLKIKKKCNRNVFSIYKAGLEEGECGLKDIIPFTLVHVMQNTKGIQWAVVHNAFSIISGAYGKVGTTYKRSSDSKKKKSYGNTELKNWNVCDMQNQSSVVNRFHYLRRSVKSGMITIIGVVMGNYQDDINHSLTASHPVCILTRIHPYCHPSTCIVSGNARHWYCN